MGKDTEKTFEQLINQLQVHESEDQLIIGIDFGTTFSGIAYAFTNPTKTDIRSILDWPGLEGHQQPKVPTLISYDPNDKSKFAWGELARTGTNKYTKIEGIKLLLDPEQEKPLYVPETNTKAELKKLGKPAVEVAADYLEALYKHAMERIESKVQLEYLEMCQKKFVLTVPAVWSDKAKDTTMRAAKQAGIYPVTLIKEPEAAALYTLHIVEQKALTVGDAFVICDAGGGTVDLISYEVLSLTPKLELKELVPSKGGMAGSLQLNKRFEQAVKNLVGEDQFYHLRQTQGFAEAISTFDRTVKLAFRGKDDESWFVSFPMAELADDPENGLKNCMWQMKSETVKDIFKPLITNIREMIDTQVNHVRVHRLKTKHPKAEEVKAIFLVGGFGASEYLKQSVADAHPDIQILQPHDAWSAIVKGAVLSQLPHEALVMSSVAPRHYGVSAYDLFDEEKDKDQAKTRDDSTGKWRVQKMTWFIMKNEDLKRDQKIRFPFYRTLGERYASDELVFRDELISDDSIRPAPYPKAGVTKVNCVLKADLSSVDRSNFTKRTGVDGNAYIDIHYDLVVAIKSAQMKFSLEIKGQELGSVDATYN